jgi:methionyl-tRNA formyltransferase
VPGEVLECGPQGPLVAAGEGAVRLLEVQPEGKRAMSGAEFVRGRPLGVGARLG